MVSNVWLRFCVVTLLRSFWLRNYSTQCHNKQPCVFHHTCIFNIALFLTRKSMKRFQLTKSMKMAFFTKLSKQWNNFVKPFIFYYQYISFESWNNEFYKVYLNFHLIIFGFEIIIWIVPRTSKVYSLVNRHAENSCCFLVGDPQRDY